MLDKLADKKRDVFVLHELEGHTPAEIARIVGAPVLTVRTRLFYARRDLEKLMREEPSLAAVLDRLDATTASTSELDVADEATELRSGESHE